MKIYQIKTAALDIAYTGVVSPDTIKSGTEQPWEGLLDKFDIPDGWTTYGSHMTINQGPTRDPNILNKTVQLTVKALGTGKGVMAVLVESSQESESSVPHITIATAPNVLPKKSNEIKSWNPITPFTLSGVIAEISRGTVVTDEMRQENRRRIEEEKRAKREERERKREEKNRRIKEAYEQGILSGGSGLEGVKKAFPGMPDSAIKGMLLGIGITDPK
jgi:hypothetical protein